MSFKLEWLKKTWTASWTATFDVDSGLPAEFDYVVTDAEDFVTTDSEDYVIIG